MFGFWTVSEIISNETEVVGVGGSYGADLTLGDYLRFLRSLNFNPKPKNLLA